MRGEVRRAAAGPRRSTSPGETGPRRCGGRAIAQAKRSPCVGVRRARRPRAPGAARSCGRSRTGVSSAIPSVSSRLARPLDRLPADVRHLEPGGVEAVDLALDQAEPSRAAELGRGFEQQLEAEADAEHGRPGRDPLGDQRVELELADPLHRLRERAHPGQDQAVGVARDLGVGRESRPRRRRARAPSRPSAGCPSRSRGSQIAAST